MIMVPDAVKEKLKDYGVHTNVRVRFPNGERDDLTNKDISYDSFKFKESVCSKKAFKFGLCEAGAVEFECFDVENIKGYEIDVSVEIDLSGCGEDVIARYGKTDVGVSFPFYRIPLGHFTVYSCQWMSDMYRRKVIAYDALNSKNLDKDLSDLGIIRPDPMHYISLNGPTGMNYSEFFRFNINHYLRTFAVNSGMCSIAQEFGSLSGTFIRNSEEKRVAVRENTLGIGAVLYMQEWTYHPPSDRLTNFGLKSTIALRDFDSQVRKDVQSICRKYSIIFDDVHKMPNPVTVTIIGERDVLIPDDSHAVPLQRYMTPGLLTEWSDFSGINTLTLSVPLRIEIYSTGGGSGGGQGSAQITTLETMKFGECPDLEMYCYNADSIFAMEMSEEIKITSYRNLLESCLELAGKFARISRESGTMEYLTLGTDPFTIDRSMYESVWNDDYLTKEYGSINARYLDREGKEQVILYRFGEGENVYYMHDNAILGSVKLSQQQVTEILERMSAFLSGISMIPFDLSGQGMPYLECGDLLHIETDRGTVATYLFQRELRGEDGTADTFKNTTEEKASGTLSSTKVTVLMNAFSTGGVDMATDDDIWGLFNTIGG